MGTSISSRRGFLTGNWHGSRNTLFPPGATEASIRNCTGCGQCATTCPTGIISIVNGIPSVDFAVGECTFCGMCAERCPELVFPLAAKLRVPHVARIGDDCLALNYVDCQACRDACPTSAIRFEPRIGGPFIPSLNPEECTGCGACLSACPSESVVFESRAAELAHA